MGEEGKSSARASPEAILEPYRFPRDPDVSYDFHPRATFSRVRFMRRHCATYTCTNRPYELRRSIARDFDHVRFSASLYTCSGSQNWILLTSKLPFSRRTASDPRSLLLARIFVTILSVIQYHRKRQFLSESTWNVSYFDIIPDVSWVHRVRRSVRRLEERRARRCLVEPALEASGPTESHCGVSATHDPSPTRGRHALQRDAARARGQWEGVLARSGPRGHGGNPRSPSPSGLVDRAQRFAQPVNSYQRQKCSLAQDTPALRSDDGRASPCKPILREYTHSVDYEFVGAMPEARHRRGNDTFLWKCLPCPGHRIVLLYNVVLGSCYA